MPDAIHAAKLKSYIERFESIDAEREAVATDLKDVSAECKADGFNVAIVKWVVKQKKIDAAKRQEDEAERELYMRAAGLI